MHRDPAHVVASRRTTMLPPPPNHAEVLESCWEPMWCDELTEDDFDSVPRSSAPTYWQAPPTVFDTLLSDTIHYRTIASALKL